MNRRLLSLVALVVIGGVCLVLLRSSQIATFMPTQSASDLACPHAPDSVFALSGAITPVPEYHDCQALIDPSGTAYGPRVGLYVRMAMDTVAWPATTTRCLGPRSTTPVARVGGACPASQPTAVQVPGATAVALVHNLDQTAYVPLDIQPGFSCLYLETQTAARLVKVAQESDCSAVPLVLPLPPGKDLEVKFHAATDVPQAGRWGWSTTDKAHYVVMACPGGWCEIGLPDFHPEPLPAIKNPPPGFESRWTVQPWNDIQPLAEIGPNGKLVPGEGIGYDVPVPEAGLRRKPDFKGKFVQVSWMFLDKPSEKYYSRFALGHGSLANRMIEVYVCAGPTPKDCNIPKSAWPNLTCAPDNEDPTAPVYWYAMAKGRNAFPMADLISRPVRYHCIERTSHTGVDIPGTARWRWDTLDEGKWSPCGGACCYVK